MTEQNNAGDLVGRMRLAALKSTVERAGLDAAEPEIAALLQALATDKGTEVLLAIKQARLAPDAAVVDFNDLTPTVTVGP